MGEDLKPLLLKVLEGVDAIAQRQKALEASMVAGFERVDVKFERVQSAINGLSERVARVEGRIEEQSKILQLAVAGRISRNPAAE